MTHTGGPPPTVRTSLHHASMRRIHYMQASSNANDCANRPRALVFNGHTESLPGSHLGPCSGSNVNATTWKCQKCGATHVGGIHGSKPDEICRACNRVAFWQRSQRLTSLSDNPPNVSPAFVTAPVDSDDYPISVLLTGDDLGTYIDDLGMALPITTCGQCSLAASDWPRLAHAYGSPGAMYKADLYCATCLRESYNPDTGQRVNTLTGIGTAQRP